MNAHTSPRRGLSRLLPTGSIGRGLPLALLALGLGLAAPTSASANDDVKLIQFLDNTGVAPGAKAKARLRFKDDSTDFQVELEQIASGTYELYVSGDHKGDIHVGAAEGEIEFKIPFDSPKPLLDFDVLGEPIEVRRDGSVYFSDVFTGNGGGGGGSGGGGGGGGGGALTNFKIEIPMANVGSDPDARGRLRYEQRPDRRRLKLNVARLNAGASYELHVAGANVLQFQVPSFGEFEVTFSDPVEPGKLLLDFDPLGQQVEVVGAGETLLSAQMPGAPADTGAPLKGKPSRDVGHSKSDAILVKLFAQSAVGVAQADARLSEQAGGKQLAVELRQSLSGVVSVAVNGVPRGVFALDGTGTGTLVFSETPDAGELPLDFALPGALLELRSGTTTLFSRTLPRSLGEAVSAKLVDTQKKTSLKRALVSTGEDLDARAVLRLREFPTGTLLRLRVRDLSAGDYTLRLSGVDVGVLSVAPGKSGGVFSLDSRKSPGSLPAEFALVELLRDGVVWLATELPES